MAAGVVGGISGLAGSAAASARAQGNSFADLSSEQFIKILVTELANQDPFEPTDSAALLEQLSSLRNIESQLALQEQFEGLVLQNQITQAGSLIGKVVSGLDDANNQVNGLVTSVRIQDDQAVLELDSGRLLAMDRVTEIAALE